MGSKADNSRYQKEQSLTESSFKKVRGLCFIFILLAFFPGFYGTRALAQDTASNKNPAKPNSIKTDHSPRRATYYALVLPGLGQVYNHKYWKVPIVYVGFGACIYFITTNHRYYKELKDAYTWASVTNKIIYPPTPPNILHPIPDPPNDWAKNYSEDKIKEGRDYYRRNLEISYIATGAWYILTVVDAVVDAHFFDYDINDDLTLQVRPWSPAVGVTSTFGVTTGLNLTLRF